MKKIIIILLGVCAVIIFEGYQHRQEIVIKFYTHLETKHYNEYKYVEKWGFWKLFAENGELIKSGWRFRHSTLKTDKIQQILIEYEKIKNIGSHMVIIDYGGNDSKSKSANQKQ